MATFAAVDIGASSGRVIAGAVTDAGGLDIEVVHRFPNGVVERDGHLRWDFNRLLAEVETGLKAVPGAESVGISTWGVDYGLLDEHGTLLADPIAYRDDRTTEVIEEVHARVDPVELYETTGVQFLPFNTIYQLAAERLQPIWARTAHVALIPDLVAHHLTGELRTELTNASTTGLLDARTRQWALPLLDRLGIERDLLPPIEAPGSVRGHKTDGTPVVSVGSHDTASAVVGVPATSEHFAYIVSGTWSLVGLELDSPVLTDAARQANFTNEAGVDGRTRFLRNVGGLWLLQECLREWGRDDLDALLAAAAALPRGGPLVDADNDAFIPPGDMPERVATSAGRELTEAETVRCILDSLAAGYARTIETASALAERPVDIVHVVGGGSQNELLCQLTADATGLPVLAGPVEATARGNLIVQARTAGDLPESLAEIRDRSASTLPLRRYQPA
ncbi:MAG: rhamnulokinase [Acidimicrobiales bacterium]|nr:rhamnulokinase [Acidimicrobiales bacterium]